MLPCVKGEPGKELAPPVYAENDTQKHIPQRKARFAKVSLDIPRISLVFFRFLDTIKQDPLKNFPLVLDLTRRRELEQQLGIDVIQFEFTFKPELNLFLLDNLSILFPRLVQQRLFRSYIGHDYNLVPFDKSHGENALDGAFWTLEKSRNANDGSCATPLSHLRNHPSPRPLRGGDWGGFAKFFFKI